MKKVILSAFLTMVLVFGCKHDLTYPDPEPQVPPDPISDCHQDTIYFENNILPLLLSNCAFSGCHDAASAENGVILDNYEDIINTGDVDPFDPGNSKIYEKIIETDPDDIMPPPPNEPLTADQINMIMNWINQGALNNGCEGCDTLNVTFSEAVSPIIENKCQGCHSGSEPSGDLWLTDHTEISAVALDGSLFGSINHDDGYTPMPYNGNQLPQCEIDIIRIWIEDGAPDN